MSYKHIKLFVTDLDGTLFSTWGSISPLAADTLKKLRESGVKVVLSTGRPFFSVQKSIPEEYYDYACCMNGQDIYIVSEKRHIFRPELSEDDVRELSSSFRRFPLIMNAATKDRSVYVCSPVMIAAYFIRDIPRNIKRILTHRPLVKRDYTGSLSEIDGQPIAKLCFAGTSRSLHRFQNQINKNRFSCFFVNSRWMEVMAAGISKGAALSDILQMENLSPDQCAAIGDGENDLSLFDVAGTRIAMSNAMPRVKEAANAYARSVKEDGCAKWITEHLL